MLYGSQITTERKLNAHEYSGMAYNYTSLFGYGNITTMTETVQGDVLLEWFVKVMVKNLTNIQIEIFPELAHF
jgi:hypothetical protein